MVALHDNMLDDDSPRQSQAMASPKKKRRASNNGSTHEGRFVGRLPKDSSKLICLDEAAANVLTTPSRPSLGRSTGIALKSNSSPACSKDNCPSQLQHNSASIILYIFLNTFYTSSVVCNAVAWLTTTTLHDATLLYT